MPEWCLSIIILFVFRIHGIGGSFYDYVFIDEAGHAEEPLSLIPAVGLLKRTIEETIGGNLILAGDPKQLGPIIHSRLASYLGLGELKKLKYACTWNEVWIDLLVRRYLRLRQINVWIDNRGQSFM